MSYKNLNEISPDPGMYQAKRAAATDFSFSSSKTSPPLFCPQKKCYEENEQEGEKGDDQGKQQEKKTQLIENV